MTQRRFKWRNLYLWLVFIVLYAPIIFLVVYSFSKGDTMTNFHGFTWSHYQDLFADTRLIAIFLDTLLIALLSSLLATAVGTLGALGINNTTRPVTKNTLLAHLIQKNRMKSKRVKRGDFEVV